MNAAETAATPECRLLGGGMQPHIALDKAALHPEAAYLC
jgi:hypothetical protein